MEDSLSPIEIHQSVFGYDDGHRLLAASNMWKAAIKVGAFSSSFHRTVRQMKE